MISPDLQLRIFGYVDPVEPLPGSWKAMVYEAVSNPNITDAQIELLARSAKKMSDQIEKRIIASIKPR